MPGSPRPALLKVGTRWSEGLGPVPGSSWLVVLGVVTLAGTPGVGEIGRIGRVLPG